MKISNELKDNRGKKSKDLYQDLQKQCKKLRELQFNAQFRKNKDIRIIDKTKKSIARLWTVLREKLEEENGRKTGASDVK